MDEQYIRNYIKQNTIQGKWYKHDEIDMIVGACKYIENHTNILNNESKSVIERYSVAIPQYMASLFRLLFFGKSRQRKRYTMQHVEIDCFEKTEEYEKEKNWMKEILSPEAFDECYYEDKPMECGEIPMDIIFRDAIMEYTGRQFSECEKTANHMNYKGITLDEEKDPYYRMKDEMQMFYNRDIRRFMKEILRNRGFYYFYKGRKHYKSFRNVSYDIMDIIVELYFDWFIENTEIGNIFYVKDVVEMDGWGSKTLLEIFGKTEKQVQNYCDIYEVVPTFHNINEIGRFCLFDYI